MKILIFSENCSDAHKESIRRITDELKRRGHAVHSLSVMQEDAPSLQQPSLRRRMMQKKYHEAALREYAGKLKKTAGSRLIRCFNRLPYHLCKGTFHIVSERRMFLSFYGICILRR